MAHKQLVKTQVSSEGGSESQQAANKLGLSSYISGIYSKWQVCSDQTRTEMRAVSSHIATCLAHLQHQLWLLIKEVFVQQRSCLWTCWCPTVDNGLMERVIMRRLIYRLSRGGTNGAQWEDVRLSRRHSVAPSAYLLQAHLYVFPIGSALPMDNPPAKSVLIEHSIDWNALPEPIIWCWPLSIITKAPE